MERLRITFLISTFFISTLIVVAGCTVGVDRSIPDVGFGVDTNAPDDTTPPDTTPPDTGPVVCDPGSTVGTACVENIDCSDNCFCNGIELCEAGSCVAGVDPCNDGVDCTMDACDDEGDVCVNMPQNEMCSDGDACNGIEVCSRATGGCRAAAPLYCNDEDSCTVDSCDAEMGCVHSPRDLDGDGFASGACGGEDCDDDPRFGRDIFPGATEDCTNRRDDNCDGLRDFLDASCVPENDSCDSPIPLPGPGTYSGSTRGLRSDHALSCQATGADAVFQFRLEETMDVRATLGGGGSNAAVAIRPFAMCETGPDIRCNRATPPVAFQRSLPAGDYAIIVKTSGAAGQVFDLVLMFEPATEIPPVDVCNDDTLDVSAGGSFEGMFLEVEDDYRLSCRMTSSFKEAAYRFTLTEVQDVTLTARSTGGSFTSSTAMSILTDCTDASSTLQCRSATANEIRLRSLAPGTYFVLVEPTSTVATGWNLDVSITDPVPRVTGDACETAIDISTAPGMVGLDTIELDTGTSCGGSTGTSRDANFSFTLTETRDVTVTSNGAGFHFQSLSTRCGTTGAELRCRSGSGALSQTFRSLPAGTYFLTVATTLRAGTITASVETRPPTPVPPNDRCGGAINVTGGYTSNDTVVGFEDDSRGCTGVNLPDAFYTFTLSRPQTLLAVASSIGAVPQTMYLTLRGADCAGANLQCANGRPATIDTPMPLAPGTYHLMVEMLERSASDYRLRVIFD